MLKIFAQLGKNVNLSLIILSITFDITGNNEKNYVLKEDNPSNVSQLRPVEEFWARLSKKIYDNGWEAQNVACRYSSYVL